MEKFENLDFSDVREEQAATTDASSAIQNSKLGLSLDQKMHLVENRILWI